jgi:hypothetical protein
VWVVWEDEVSRGGLFPGSYNFCCWVLEEIVAAEFVEEGIAREIVVLEGVLSNLVTIDIQRLVVMAIVAMM